MAFITMIKAIMARGLFGLHAFITVWILVQLKGGNVYFWYFLAPLMMQAFESIVSICARGGQEMKWYECYKSLNNFEFK